jgi:hypothetical protein
MYPTMGFTHCKARKHMVNIILNLNKCRSLGTRGEGLYIYSLRVGGYYTYIHL